MQVDPPQVDDLTCTNSFDAPTVLAPTQLSEVVVPVVPVLPGTGSGSNRDDSILID